MPDDPASLALLCGAALIAGALNAIAGGGSFLTLPALVFTGVPIVTANATRTITLLPGYAAARWVFTRTWRDPPGLSLRTLTFLSLFGGGLGAVWPENRGFTISPISFSLRITDNLREA